MRRGGGCSCPGCACGIDLIPTLAALAGATAPHLPGIDLSGALTGTATARRDGLLITSDAQSSGLGLPGLRYCIRGVITDRYSFGRYSTPDQVDGHAGDFTYELYDRDTDPGELHSLASDRTARRLVADLNPLVDDLAGQQLTPLGTS